MMIHEPISILKLKDNKETQELTEKECSEWSIRSIYLFDFSSDGRFFL